MATKNITQDQQALLVELLAALNGEQGATSTPVAPKKEKVEQRPAHEELFEERGIKPAKGSTVLTAEGIKAAARVLKSGKPEAVASPEGNGDHVVLFVTDKGNLRVQNAYTPKS